MKKDGPKKITACNQLPQQHHEVGSGLIHKVKLSIVWLQKMGLLSACHFTVGVFPKGCTDPAAGHSEDQTLAGNTFHRLSSRPERWPMNK